MRLRFCLYGFLKNQRYYEPFLLLFLIDKGLSFFAIGGLVAFRELWVNLLEVPSGAAADLYGRRRTMVIAWLAYLSAFAVFTWGASIPFLLLAMGGLACGDAFRSGTHKAMIFDWLAHRGRQDEKASFYGLTRSWSQIGSAVSVLIAAGIVLGSGSYERIFLYSMVPYGLGLINFLGYPAELDRRAVSGEARPRMWTHLRDALRACWQQRPLRRLLSESMLQRGTYTSLKDYLQPILEQAALALPLILGFQQYGLEQQGRTAVLIAGVYCLLYLGSATASRQAHRIEKIGGGPSPTARKIWWMSLVVYVVLGCALVEQWTGLVIAVFVLMALIQNVWKPLFVARVDEVSEQSQGATLFSIDSQSKALFVMIVAPVLGLAVDQVGWIALAGLGVITGLLGLWTVGKGSVEPPPTATPQV